MPTSEYGAWKRIDRVAQAALLARFLEQPRRHAAAEHVGEHLQADKRRIVSAAGRAAPARYAPARARASRHARRRRICAGSGAGLAGPVEAREALFDLGDHRLVIDRAGGGDHHVGRRDNGGRDSRATCSPSNERTVFARAENRAAERLVGKGGGLQMLEHQIVGRVGDRADLLDDDVLLAQRARRGRRPARTGCRRARRAPAARRP